MSAIKRFLICDGADGAGKSTQLRLLAKGLIERGVPVYLNRLLGGDGNDWLQNQLRKVLLDPDFPADSVEDEERLFAVTDLRGLGFMETWLKANPTGVALMDRGIASHIAYAGAKGMKPLSILKVHADVISAYDRLADLYGLANVVMVPEDERLAMERVASRGEQTTPRLENLETQRYVIQAMKDFRLEDYLGSRNTVEVLVTARRDLTREDMAGRIETALVNAGVRF